MLWHCRPVPRSRTQLMQVKTAAEHSSLLMTAPSGCASRSPFTLAGWILSAVPSRAVPSASLGITASIGSVRWRPCRLKTQPSRSSADFSWWRAAVDVSPLCMYSSCTRDTIWWARENWIVGLEGKRNNICSLFTCVKALYKLGNSMRVFAYTYTHQSCERIRPTERASSKSKRHAQPCMPCLWQDSSR